MAMIAGADRRASHVVRATWLLERGRCCSDSRPAFWRRWPDSSAFAFLSRSHSGRGIQQDLTAFVKLMHIDMNYGDVVETLLRAQTRRNGAVPISIYPRVKKEIF
ncbi:hypothetical protein [Burkholderia pseudomallei]|uniref:hypothetical protein n=1 Tax=Burkholderia pseudomallei TaxID=28450 RepID=UPI001378E2FA|nr:hypothetical protein [Burkholderia pseudomallei]